MSITKVLEIINLYSEVYRMQHKYSAWASSGSP